MERISRLSRDRPSNFLQLPAHGNVAAMSCFVTPSSFPHQVAAFKPFTSLFAASGPRAPGRNQAVPIVDSISLKRWVGGLRIVVLVSSLSCLDLALCTYYCFASGHKLEKRDGGGEERLRESSDDVYGASQWPIIYTYHSVPTREVCTKGYDVLVYEGVALVSVVNKKESLQLEGELRTFARRRTVRYGAPRRRPIRDRVCMLGLVHICFANTY
jgi:hypothetical protein